MTAILRPTLFTFATVFAAQNAVGAQPGYVAGGYQAKTVFEASEEGRSSAPARSLHQQLASKRRSKSFDRLFDAEDRRAFRRLKKIAKRRGRGSGRVLMKFPPAMPGDTERLAEEGLSTVARYLVATGLEPTKLVKYAVEDDSDPHIAVDEESNAYVRVQDGKLRDVYTWAHQVVAVRSTYETTDHNLYVYADDGRLRRVYTYSDGSGGVALTRVDVKWRRDRVARLDVRSAEGGIHYDPINLYRIDRIDAPTLVAVRR